MTQLLPVGTGEAKSDPFEIIPLIWSPDERETIGLISSGSDDYDNFTRRYDGQQLAPRDIALLLHGDETDNLSPSACVVIETQVTDHHWEEIGRLTPTKKQWSRRSPIGPTRVRRLDGRCGVAIFGLPRFATTGTAS